MSNPRALVAGQRFGRLTVAKYYGDGKYWCMCDCGGNSFPSSWNLKRGGTKSCGCFQKSHKTLAGDEGTFRQFYRAYKTDGLRRGHQFFLTMDDFKSITSSACFYCGAEPTPYHGYNRKLHKVPYVCNGVDRKNNDGDYIVENCVPCCSTCNYMKRALGLEEFTQHVAKIATYIQGKQ
jgi:hypothetical protein